MTPDSTSHPDAEPERQLRADEAADDGQQGSSLEGSEGEPYPEPLPFTPDPAQEGFAAAAPARIRRMVPVLAVGLTVACWPLFGWRNALGFAAGSAIATMNFRWLEQGIAALLDRMTDTGKSASGAGVFLRFFLRFGLVIGVAYATLYSYPGSLYGFLAGLFVPVAAILLEALHQTWTGLSGRS